MTKRTGPLLRGALGALAVAALASACHRAPAVSSEPVAVKVATVERAAGATGIRYSARIEPASKVDLAFKVAGYVDTISKAPGIDGKPRLLQEGDSVREGQALASVRPTDYQQRLAEARAAQDQAKAAFDQTQRDLERDEKLAATGAISPAQVEQERSRLTSTRATAEGAKARVDEASTALGDTTLRSPMNGTVLKRRVEQGALATSGTVAFTVADVSSVKAVFAVPDSILPRLHLGAAQVVSLDAYPGVPFTGRISRISPSADPKSMVFEAEVLIPNPDGRLKAGSVAALSLEANGAGSEESSPLVPLAAIVRSPGKARGFAVYVVDDVNGQPTAHAREIELGQYLGRVIPVKKGLSGGERIVVLGAGLLSDNERVELIP